MLRLTATQVGDTQSACGSLRAALASIACLVRSVPLFFRARPATPLRVLCIVALESIHVLRHSSPFTRERRETLSILLDFQACTNAAWDDKPLRSSEYEAFREQLEAAGLASWIRDYLDRLCRLETERPTVGSRAHNFNAVRRYREAVVRLSLATVAGIALNARHVDEAIDCTDSDSDVAALFHMAMQCQVIDDVLDYRDDAASGLPGFITATSLPQALALTAHSVRSYGRGRSGRNQSRARFPLRVALRILTALATLSVRTARWMYDDSFWNDAGQIDY